MADSVSLLIDETKLKADGDRLTRQYLTAGTRAVAGTTKGLERKLEAATQAGVPGKLWKAWGSSSFPKSGPAQNPAGVIFLNGGARTRGAIKFWTEPGEIRGKGGQYLAIPLPAAGARGRKRDLTPGEWERAHPGVRLQFIYRQGKPSLLVAIGTTKARGGTFRKLTTGKRGRIAQGRVGADPLNSAVVPIFLLLPLVRFRNAFAVNPLIAESEGALARAFFDEIRALR